MKKKMSIFLPPLTKQRSNAKYLIGCDGAHSIVRKTIGCSFKGISFPDIFSLADVKVEWDYPHDEVHAFLENKGIMAAIPLSTDKRYRLVFQLPRLRKKFLKKHHVEHGVINSEKKYLPTIEEIQELLSSAAPVKVKVSDPHWIATL